MLRESTIFACRRPSLTWSGNPGKLGQFDQQTTVAVMIKIAPPGLSCEVISSIVTYAGFIKILLQLQGCQNLVIPISQLLASTTARITMQAVVCTAYAVSFILNVTTSFELVSERHWICFSRRRQWCVCCRDSLAITTSM